MQNTDKLITEAFLAKRIVNEKTIMPLNYTM